MSHMGFKNVCISTRLLLRAILYEKISLKNFLRLRVGWVYVYLIAESGAGAVRPRARMRRP